jgi:hypothetical protein
MFAIKLGGRRLLVSPNQIESPFFSDRPYPFFHPHQ